MEESSPADSGVADGIDVPPADDLEAARARGGYLEGAGLGRAASLGDAEGLVPAPFIPSLAAEAEGEAPALGQHTEAVLRELGLE